MDTPMRAESMTITGHNGDEIEAISDADVSGSAPESWSSSHAGLRPVDQEIVRTFAPGYAAARNPHHRWRPAPRRPWPRPRDAGGVPDDQCIGDGRRASNISGRSLTRTAAPA
jgi:hypothetical protein